MSQVKSPCVVATSNQGVHSICANLSLLLECHIRNSKSLFLFPIINCSACGVRKKIRTLWRTKTEIRATQAYKYNFIQDCRAAALPSSIKDDLSQLYLHSGLLRVQMWKSLGLSTSF